MKYKEEFHKALNENNIEAAKEILIKSINEKKQQGWKIEQNITYDFPNRKCCAIGSLLSGRGSSLGFFFTEENNKITDIIRGFDNKQIYFNPIWYNLGKELFEISKCL